MLENEDGQYTRSNPLSTGFVPLLPPRIVDHRPVPVPIFIILKSVDCPVCPRVWSPQCDSVKVLPAHALFLILPYSRRKAELYIIFGVPEKGIQVRVNEGSRLDMQDTIDVYSPTSNIGRLIFLMASSSGGN